MIKNPGEQTILYFFSQKGCGACALQKPIVQQVNQANFGKIMVLELDINRHESLDDWSPKATPAFAVKSSGVLLATREGSMTFNEIEKFIDRAVSGRGDDNETSGSGARPARRRKRRNHAEHGEGGDQVEGGESEPELGSDAE